MLTVGKAASHDLYYDKADDYYRGDARAAARWFGKGAGELGLLGRIDRADSRAAFAGSRELFGRELGRTTGGTRSRLPGVDLTFSAPKSLSILALVAGDERLTAAHDEAVRATLAFVERSAAARVREGAIIRQERTGKLVVATWRHDTSRAQDPQLHTHAVVINATQTADGQWRSLDTRPFFTTSFAKEVGARYRAELAARVRALGYRLETGKDCTFEIRGVSAAERARFSQRAAQIDRALARRGIDPAKATAAQLKVIVKDTRAAKIAIDRADLQRLWHERAGADLLTRLAGLRQEVQVRGRSQAQGTPREPAPAAGHEPAIAGGEPDVRGREFGALLGRQPAPPGADRVPASASVGGPPLPASHQDIAERAVASAARHLSERDARFTHDALVRAASERAFGRAAPAAIEAAVETAAARGELAARSVRAYDPALRMLVEQDGWTTRQAIRIEQAMLARLHNSRGTVPPIADGLEASRVVAAAEAASQALGHGWTPDQREATRTLLGGRDRISALQGLAGTGKTSTVLAALAEAVRARGFAVTPLATTGSAARTLGAALGAEAQTVDRFLGQLKASAGPASTHEVWIVDEASMLSARLTERLLTAAEAADARILLVGDVRQLGSVEAGAAFRQLQEHGLLTARLETIVRQTNADARDAVYAAAKGDPVTALGRLAEGGGSVIEAETVEARRTALADAYVQALLAALERHADAPAAFAEVLAIDPSREGREALTQEIRERLKVQGVTGTDELAVTALERRDLTHEEARDALRYRTGDVIRFGAAVRRHGIAPGEHLRVVTIDAHANTLTLERPAGGTFAWRPDLRGSGLHLTTVFARRERRLAEGDRVVLTRNDPRGWTNGTTALVQAIDASARTARLRLDDGRFETLALDQDPDRHWRHGYVKTAYGAQGRTTGEVFAHAESWRVNLVTQESLYVLLSRAKRAAHLYTDSREKLAEALAGRSGQRATALEAGRDRARNSADEREIGLALGSIAMRAMGQVRLLTERIAAALQRVRAGANERAEPVQQRHSTRDDRAHPPAHQAGPHWAIGTSAAPQRSR